MYHDNYQRSSAMRERRVPANTAPYDAIVIGAGICGVIFLKYARDQGLRCLALVEN